jgi:PAS domain S-box-containing protein
MEEAVSGELEQLASRFGEGELQFRSLLEKLPAAAYTCDPEGLITYFNQQAERLWGRSPRLNDPVDRFCGSFKLFASDGAPISHDQCWMALALKDEAGYNGHEIVIERPDGKRLTTLAYANPIRDHAGKLAGAVNVLVDVSERKRYEDALREADRSKNEFLATLAHELRNPLAPVRNAVEILNRKVPPSPDSRWALDVIDRQMQQMTRLIDDLLDIARITCNRLELRRERVDLADVVNAAVETSRALVDARDHELVVSLPPRPIDLDGDVTRLEQAISNLLNNAAKYTEKGGHIWVKAERDGREAVITVRDTGVGISAEMLPLIFDMFTQVDRSLERSQGGLGIGLTLVKRLVELHGGAVSAASDGPGKGSEFVVRLPIVAESAKTLPQSMPERANPGPTRSLRILVVDDNRDSTESLGLLLRLSGHDVRGAYDGLEAIGAADEFRPDVVLLDIGLPKMDGYDVARRLRQEPWGQAMVVIAVTGWGQEEDRQRSIDAGFDHHLVKPVDPLTLLELLASFERAANALPDPLAN